MNYLFSNHDSTKQSGHGFRNYADGLWSTVNVLNSGLGAFLTIPSKALLKNNALCLGRFYPKETISRVIR